MKSDTQFRVMLTPNEKKEIENLSKALSTTQSNIVRLGVRYLKKSLTTEKK